MSHGFTSDKDSKFYLEMEQELCKIGVGSLRYTYFGHERTFGEKDVTVSSDVTISKCVDSLKSAIKFVQSKGDYKIILLGMSFGGLLSIIVGATNQEVKALVLKSSVTSPYSFWFGRLGNEKVAQWKKDGILHYDDSGEKFDLKYSFWEDLLNYRHMNFLGTIHCPVLIVYGSGDSVVPINQSIDFAKKTNSELRRINGADHSYTTNPKQYNKMKKFILDFIKKMS